MKNNKIDIIIPAYKAHSTMFKTLSSIAIQTILNDIEVTIVNDCCPEGNYQEFVKLFSPYMNIKELVLDQNVGSGSARQYGMDNTNNEFIVFIDADDTFLGSFTLQNLREKITSKETFKCCSFNFLELVGKGLDMVPHRQDMIWLFGKIYRREFIDQYEIKFCPTKTSSDVGFNTLVKLYCNNDNEQICYVDDFAYYWHFKEDSITRAHDYQYELDRSICSWVDNMIFVTNEYIKHRPDDYMGYWSVELLATMYCHYIKVSSKNPVFEEQCFEYAKKLYHNCCKQYKGIDIKIFNAIVYQTIQNINSNPSMSGVIPKITLYNFVDRLMEEKYDEDYIYEVYKKIPKELIKNNEDSGICFKGYTEKQKKKRVFKLW